MLRRNKIQLSYAVEVWVVVEVLDEISGVHKVTPQNEPSLEKVLHRSNFRPWVGGEKSGVEG